MLRSSAYTRSSTACGASSSHVDSAKIDRQEGIPEEVLRGLKELGLFGMAIPQSHGGIGLTTTGYARVMQEMAGLDPSVARDPRRAPVDRAEGAPALRHRRAEEPVPATLATGELVAAFALTEPGAGSDAAAIKTRADLQPDGSYVLNGSKIWITNGGFADFFTVFARTSRADADAKPKITAFLVERGLGREERAPTSTSSASAAARRPSSSSTTCASRRATCSARPGAASRSRWRSSTAAASASLAAASASRKRVIKLAIERVQGAPRVRPHHRRVRPHQGQDRHDDGRTSTRSRP